HDTPRLPGTGSPYSALADTFGEFHFAHRMAYQRFELPGLVVHAVPQMLTVEATLAALDEAERGRSGDRTNLLLTHPGVPQVEPTFAATTSSVELVALDAMPAQWARYVDQQTDLVNYDRDKLRDLGTVYLSRAVEEALD